MSSGIHYERALCKHFLKQGLKFADEYSKDVYMRGVHLIPSNLSLNIPNLPARSWKPHFVRLERPSSGSSFLEHPTTSDITLISRDRTQYEYISVKNNNMDIKHQKPNKLPLQMRMCARSSIEFNNAYNAINNKWFQKWNKMRFTTFREAPRADIDNLYRSVNKLVISYLNTEPVSRTQRFLKFLLDLDTRYVFKFEGIRKCTIFKKIMVKKTIISAELRGSNTIILKLSNNVKVYMRLHTACSRISPMLCLKYAVKAEDLFNKLY